MHCWHAHGHSVRNGYIHRNPPLYDSRQLSKTLSDRVAVRYDASADSAVCTAVASEKLVFHSPLCTPLPREMPTATLASSPWR